jgi:sulfatase maturation enzyme AslB (radical SAM superfamily)
MTWTCPAIDYGVSIFPDQKIRPCCQIDSKYSKPLTFIKNPDRFSDLKTLNRPLACKKCWENEDNGYNSYRQHFLLNQQTVGQGIKYLDFRHSNQCNLKCRYCNPHFSNQWDKELNSVVTILQSDITDYIDTIITDDLEDLYWCGGEPLILNDHYRVLKKVIDLGLSKKINIRYNTNLTVLKYKTIDIEQLWTQFKSVNVGVSIDAVGEKLNYIRSGASWNLIEKNILKLLELSQIHKNINFSLLPTVSILNIWFLPELFEFATKHNIPVYLNVLSGPDYLSLDAIPTQLQNNAKQIIESIRNNISKSDYKKMNNMLIRDDNEYLFLHAIRHILLLDKIRNENLFDFLPFKNLAIDLTLKNYEYN